MPAVDLPQEAGPLRPQEVPHPVLHLPLFLQVQEQRGDLHVGFAAPLPLSLKTSPPIGDAAALFSVARLGAPVQGSEGQMTPFRPRRPLLDVCRYVRLAPLLVRLKGDKVISAERGDPGPAARGLRGLGGAPRSGGGRRGPEVDEGGSHQLL